MKSTRAHELLRQLAEEEQQSMQAVLDSAIERYRRESSSVEQTQISRR
jgi:hypothetical protein